jgi:SAM-dependent methyltransferase
VREGGDAPYAWNGPLFFELLPPPGRLTVEIASGEGRIARELTARGHRVIAFEASPTLVARAREADPGGDYRVADAAMLPLGDGEADLVVAFMALQDIRPFAEAIAEAGRVLSAGGRFCFANVHPLATAGKLDEDDAFVIRNYCEPFEVERPLGNLHVTQFHRSFEEYSRALEAAGFAIELLREIPMRRRAAGRLPAFLHIHALKS